MANNIDVSQGSGKTVATEDLGGAQYQLIKVVGGPTGSGSIMTVNPDGSIKVSVIGALSATISGSVLAVAAGNQSVSGAVTHPPGSVSAIRTDNASVITVSTNVGSVIAVIQGSVTAIASGNQSVSGTVTAPPGSIMQVMGSVQATQSTNPWVVTGSVQAVVLGSIAAFQGGTNITSLVSTVPSSVIVGASIFGQLPAGTAPLGSVATLQGTNPWIITGSVQGIGSVASFQAGTQITSVMNIIPSSMLVGASIFGQLPAGTAPLGSVATLQGTNPWVTLQVGSVITTSQNSSIIAVNAGSVFAIIQSSITGTYAEDAAHASADKGLFVLGVRNDLMASVTSADLDYSAYAVGPVGEMLVANAPITKWFNFQTSVMYGVSVQAVAVGGTSVFNYMTGLQIANDSGTYSRVKITGGLGSVLAWTVAPANGGSNIVFGNPVKTGENSGISVSISGISSVYATIQGFTAKA